MYHQQDRLADVGLARPGSAAREATGTVEQPTTDRTEWSR